jgi:hypothetical protein
LEGCAGSRADSGCGDRLVAQSGQIVAPKEYFGTMESRGIRGTSGDVASQVLVLDNMVGPGVTCGDSETWGARHSCLSGDAGEDDNDLEAEVREECGRFGQIICVHIHSTPAGA